MATNVLLFISAFGLVFLIYALINFGREWRRYIHDTRSRLPVGARVVGDRVAIIPAVYLYPKNSGSVIPFPARYRQINLPLVQQGKSGNTIEMRKRIVPEQGVGRAC